MACWWLPRRPRTSHAARSSPGPPCGARTKTRGTRSMARLDFAECGGGRRGCQDSYWIIGRDDGRDRPPPAPTACEPGRDAGRRLTGCMPRQRPQSQSRSHSSARVGNRGDAVVGRSGTGAPSRSDHARGPGFARPFMSVIPRGSRSASGAPRGAARGHLVETLAPPKRPKLFGPQTRHHRQDHVSVQTGVLGGRRMARSRPVSRALDLYGVEIQPLDRPEIADIIDIAR